MSAESIQLALWGDLAGSSSSGSGFGVAGAGFVRKYAGFDGGACLVTVELRESDDIQLVLDGDFDGEWLALGVAGSASSGDQSASWWCDVVLLLLESDAIHPPLAGDFWGEMGVGAWLSWVVDVVLGLVANRLSHPFFGDVRPAAKSGTGLVLNSEGSSYLGLTRGFGGTGFGPIFANTELELGLAGAGLVLARANVLG